MDIVRNRKLKNLFNISRLKYSDIPYYIYIFIFVLNDALGNTVIPNYNESIFHDILLYINLFMAFICFLQIDFKSKSSYKSILFIIIGVVSYLVGGRTALLFTIFASVFGSTVNCDNLLKMIFTEKVVIFTIVVILSLIGLLGGREVLFSDINSIEKTVTLGYSHANTFSATVGILIFLYVFINRKQLNRYKYIAILGISILTYFFTKCRMGFAIMILLVVLLNLPYERISFNKKIMESFYKILKYILLFIIGINLILIILKICADNSLLLGIDYYIFNGRIGLAAEYLKVYPLTLFGDVIDLNIISSKLWYVALDNGYIINLLYYGIIGMLVYIYIFHKSYSKFVINHQKVLIIIAICFMIWTMYEGLMITASSNFILLLYQKHVK